MCWITEIGKPVSHKARKDIICYKIVPTPNSEVIYSKIFHFEYHFGKLYKTDLGKVTQHPYYYSIEEGFHSYKELPILWRNMYITAKSGFYNIHKNIIIECIIPADSTYYGNEFGELVSDSIIVKSIYYNNGKVSRKNKGVSE